MDKQEYIKQYLQETNQIAQTIDQAKILAVIDIIQPMILTKWPRFRLFV